MVTGGIMQTLINWAMQHPAKLAGGALAVYHFSCVAVDKLPMPDNTSGKFYRWFFGVANVYAANYSRTLASTGSAGQQAPK
jgi:hypothetical protein